MELSEAMRTAASVRRFRLDPVPDDVLYRALDSARFAPSGGNQQGWHVVVVRDASIREQLQELYLRSWRPLREMQATQARSTDAAGRRRPGTDEGDHYAMHLHELPTHLVVLVRRASLMTPFQVLNESPIWAGSSIYPFVQNLLLAIRDEGLGTSLTMLFANEEAEVLRLVAAPDGYAFVAHLGVGWPERPHPTRLRRRAVEEFATLNRFDGAPLLAGPAGA